MRVLVAGGTGFVGSHVAEAFVAAGHDVRSLARRPPVATALPDVDYRVGDLGNLGDLVPSLNGVDVAVFAVTTTTPGSASGDAAFDASANLVSGILFLEAATGAGVSRLLMISSGGTIYGVPERLPIPESHPTNPISAYGITKLALEKYFALYARDAGIHATVLRVGNAFGERQDARTGQGAAAAFLLSLLRDEPVEIWGDGSVVRDYVYAGDVGRACVAAALLEPQGSSLVVNVGSGSGLSLLELLDVCSGVVGRDPQLRREPARPFDVPAVVLDVTRAAELLDWRAETSLETGLERAARWLEAVVAPQVEVRG